MKIETTDLPGVLIVRPEVFGDDRGFLLEAYRESRYREAGMTQRFVQDNLSLSRRGVLRGLHLQSPNAQAKLVSVLRGEVFDVAVDMRVGSPHFGAWAGTLLTERGHEQFLVPEGFAHGFCVLSEQAMFAYKCTAEYSPEDEITVRWDDPDIGIDWPIEGPSLSARDAAAPTLRELDRERLPQYEA